MTRTRRFIAGGGLLLIVAAAIAVLLYANRSPAVCVLLVTFDTTRADRVGCYGYADASTPVLDRLADEGVLFQRAYSAVPLTLPSHATMLTGLYPPEHGLRTNGRNSLPDDVPTLATLLSEQGYDTGAFIAAFVLDSKFGLARGFDVYDDDLSGTAETIDELHRFRSGADVVDAALAWLNERDGDPFFCWVHLYDPHHPYEQHSDRFGDRFEGRPYDAEIAFADEQLGRLVEFIDTQGLRERTLVVVAGDHGEGLGQHGEATHTYMVYDSTMRVPLICRQPGTVDSGLRVPQVVSLVDLSPTLFEWTGASMPDRISGRSLVPYLLGAELEPRPCYGESQAPLVDHGWSPVECVVSQNWKYIRTTRPELYDLADDPHESSNLLDSAPERRDELENLLALLESEMMHRDAATATLSDAEAQALASLGYVGDVPAAEARAGKGPLPDIKDMMSYVDRLHAAHELMELQEYKSAQKILSAITDEAPDLHMAQTALGLCLAELGQYEAAVDRYRKSLEINPESDAAHLNLGLACLQMGRFEEAARSLAHAVRLKPDSAFAHVRLAVALREVGAYRDAQQQAEEALRWDRDLAEAHEILGQLALAEGRLPRALEHFQAALKTAATPATVLNQIGIVQAQLRQLDAATATFRRAIERDPHLAQPHTNLAIALAEQAHYAEAVAEYERALAEQPDELTAAMNLAWLLATHPRGDIRNGQRALELAERACALTNRSHPAALDALAAALAETGRFSEAVAAMEEMLQIAEQRSSALPPGHVQAARVRLEMYQQQKPFRERYKQG